MAKKIIQLPAVTIQRLTDLYEMSNDGKGSYKETREQMIDFIQQNIIQYYGEISLSISNERPTDISSGWALIEASVTPDGAPNYDGYISGSLDGFELDNGELVYTAAEPAVFKISACITGGFTGDGEVDTEINLDIYKNGDIYPPDAALVSSVLPAGTSVDTAMIITQCIMNLETGDRIGSYVKNDINAQNPVIKRLNLVATFQSVTIEPPVENAFVSRWTTTTPNEDITLPLKGDGLYNFFVDYGDGDVAHITEYGQAESVHTYAEAGTYTVTITEVIQGWAFGYDDAYIPSASKLVEISQWGCLLIAGASTYPGEYFHYCANLVVTATDIPDLTGVTSFNNAFRFCAALTVVPNMGNWDVSNISDFGTCFDSCTLFNTNIENWDMTSTTSVESMFSDCHTYNSPLNGWSLANFSSLNSTFYNAFAFNQDLDLWQTENVTDAQYCFSGAIAFQGDISTWNMTAVLDTSFMFADSNFNGDISAWQTTLNQNMDSMFLNNTSFDIDIGGWTVSNVVSFSGTFSGATAFNKDLSAWQLDSAQNLNGTFFGATSYNQPMNSWSVVGVTTIAAILRGATSYNQPLDMWDTSSVTTMNSAFFGAVSFDQNLETWSVFSLEDAGSMFSGVTLSTENYDALLIGWALQTVQPSVPFSGGNSQYTIAALSSRNTLTGSPHNWTITDGGMIALPAFISQWNTAESGDSSAVQIQLPLNPLGVYDFMVDWGDGFPGDHITSWDQAETLHTYAVSGIYTITITDTLIGLSFPNATLNDAPKLLDISQWGCCVFASDQVTDSYFAGCSSLTNLTATDAPFLGLSTSLQEAFKGCSQLVTAPSFANFDTSTITYMVSCFEDCAQLNEPGLNAWDVSNVTTLEATFAGCTAFNKTLGAWTMPVCVSMSRMFENCSSFNKIIAPTGFWDTSSCEDFSFFMYGCSAFNMPLANIDVSSCTTMLSMFEGCTLFNQSLPSGFWDTSQVLTMAHMFDGCATYNQDLDWDLSNCTNISFMFANSGYNSNISTWVTTSITNMQGTFQASPFNGNISGWDVSSVDDFSFTFKGCTAFNHSLAWDVSAADTFEEMFYGCTSMNSLLVGWNVGGALTLKNMFVGCTSLNQSFSSWITGSTTTSYQGTFQGCTLLNQDFSSWQIGGITTAQNMFNGVTLSNANYNKLLNSWSLQVPLASVVFGGGNSHYDTTSGGVNGVTARAILTNVPNSWTITDGGTP